jgi:hypothetical protein
VLACGKARSAVHGSLVKRYGKEGPDMPIDERIFSVTLAVRVGCGRPLTAI